MDLATLGLRIENGQAVRALGEVANASERTASRAESASEKIVRAQIKQVQQFEQAQRAARQYSQLTSSDLAKATEWFDKTYGSASKVTDATMKIAASSETAGLGLGRLRQSLSSLVSQVTNTNPIVGRLASTFGVFEAGSETMVGVLAGLAAFGAYVEHLTEPMRKLTAEQDKVIESLTKLRKLQGAGPGGETVGQVQQLVDRIKSDNASIARLNTAAHSVTSGLNPAAGFMQERRADAAKKEMADLVADRDFAQKQIRAAELKGSADTNNTYVEQLASLIRYHGETKTEHANALALYKDYQSQLANLAKSHPEQLAMRATLGANIETLGGALFPKDKDKKKPEFLDTITTGMYAVQQSVETSVKWYDKEVQAADRAWAARAKFLGQSSISSIPAQLLANGSPALKAFDAATDLAKVTQARIDAENVNRTAHGRGMINEGPGSVMDRLRKSAVDAGEVVKKQLQQMGVSGMALHDILELINKDYKDIGANAPKSQTNRAADIANQTASYAHSAADAINLFGGSPKAQQAGNLLNTGANAIDDFTHGNIAQGALALASFGKQIVGFGGQSHDAARALAEASESIKTMIASLDASVNHDALGGALAAAKAADDARRSQINSSLSGKKKEDERNAALAKDAADFVAIQQQVKDKFALSQQDFTDSTKAATARANGLDYSASQLELQVQQRDTMQQLVDQGLLMLNGGGTAQQRANYTAEQTLFAAQRTAVATESLTQLANAPSGFFASTVARYAADYSSPAAFPSVTPPTTYGSFSNAPGIAAPIVNTGDIHISVDGSKDPETTARAVVKAIRSIGNSYGGMGATIADTMELMS